jgi:Concanavalin A-like lectin/glucanases superfamily
MRPEPPLLVRRRGTVALLVAIVMVLGSLGATAVAKLRADYRFEGNLRSAVGTVGKLVEEGPGGTFVTKRVLGSRQGVWKWPEGTGLRLNDAVKAVGSATEDYTMVMLLRLDSVGSYRKLIHLGAIDDDSGFYVYSRTLLAYPQDVESTRAISRDVWHQVVITRDDEGKERFYVDGDLVLRENDPDDEQVLGPDGFIRFLIDDEGTMDEESGGMIARLRIYNDALSAKQARKLGP